MGDTNPQATPNDDKPAISIDGNVGRDVNIIQTITNGDNNHNNNCIELNESEKKNINMKQDSKPIQVDPTKLYDILKAGDYSGTGTFSPTIDHPDGLNTELQLHINEHSTMNNVISFTNSILCTDIRTGHLVYDAKREGQYFYKPKHDNELFFISQTIMDNHIVSSNYGHAVGMTDDSIVFEIHGAWHVHDMNFKNTKKVVTRNGDKLHHEIRNYNQLGVSELDIIEHYDLQQL
jgi:hypothetical protein